MTKQKLHPGARWAFRIRAYVTLLILFVYIAISSMVFLLKYSNNWLVLIVWFLYVLAIILIAEVYARMAYNRWFYEFTDTNLRVERGIIWKKYSNIPYERVQNVDITRGIIARIMGFSSVNIQTAGYSIPARGYGAHTEGYIPAVDRDHAEKIREFLIKKINRHHNSKGGL